MPYIKKSRRKQIDRAVYLDDFEPGDIAYARTMRMLESLPKDAHFKDMAAEVGGTFREVIVKLTDPKWSDAEVGALVCTILEFYRRKLGPYEDAAIKKNGDIPGYERMGK